ncbi:MAG TPA: ABC transporter permease [Acidimicrobiales bacterium]|nr:ABC transporter permease [Acidimicrobiales bacterium]
MIWLRRAIQLVVTVLLVTLLTFLLTSLLPGSPVYEICQGAGNACVKQVTALDGLNKPFVVQYLLWLKHLLTGNLGYSYTEGASFGAQGVPIASLIKTAYPITLEEIVFSQVMALMVAVPLAMYAALRPNRLFDRLSTTVSFATLSVPTFIVAPLLVLIFAVTFHVFPGPAAQIPSLFSGQFLTNLHTMFLPAAVLAIGSVAVYQRLLRADMVATLEEDFILMARAKGLTTARILTRHALRPSTFTLMTVAGIQVGGLITGAVIVESVFQLNGLGLLLTHSVAQHDYPTIQAITVIVAVAYIVINLLIDSLYLVIDPRIRRARATS